MVHVAINVMFFSRIQNKSHEEHHSVSNISSATLETTKNMMKANEKENNSRDSNAVVLTEPEHA